MSVFANAYQNMLASQGRGGGLTGQAAVAALLEAVPTGQVRSNEILPFVSEEMQRRAAPKLDIAKETSQAWQGRLQNQQTGWAMIASEAGLEEGQRNFFRFFTQWMNQNQDIPEKFGKFWKEFSEQFTIAGGFPDLIRMTLEGADTIVKEWLGEEKTAHFVKDFELLSEKARSAAVFLGLMGNEQADKSFWQKASEGTAAVVGVGGSLLQGDFKRAGENLGVLGNMVGSAYMERIPHLRAISGVVDTVSGYVNPERDDEGNAIRWMNYIGKQPVYHPRGVELLTAGQGGQQSGGDTIVLNIPGVTLTTNTNSREESKEVLAEFFEDMLNR